MVQRHAMHAWKAGLNFRKLVMDDKEITSRVPKKKIEMAFDLKRQLSNIDRIFARVFDRQGNKSAKGKKTSAKKR
jgi:adenylosuccinate lyase